MSFYLIAGAPGSGKTSVGELFVEVGYDAIDTDNYPNLTKWFSKESGLAVIPPAAGMSKEWLAAHDYNWDLGILNRLLQSSLNEEIIFYGSSSNQELVLDLFDKIFLLEVDPDTIVQRLRHRANNKYGKTQSEIDHVLDWYPGFQEMYKKRGAVAIDANRPLLEVFNDIQSRL